MLQGIFIDLYFNPNNNSDTNKNAFQKNYSKLIQQLTEHSVSCFYSDSFLPIRTRIANFIQQARTLNIPLDQILYLSDSNEGLLMAQNLNLYTIGYKKDDSFLSTTYCIEDIDEIDFSYFARVLCRYRKEPVSIMRTKHLHIREITKNDLPDLYAIYQEPSTTKYMLDPLEDYETFFNKLSCYFEQIYKFYDFGMWGVFLKDSEQLIGECGIQLVTIEEKEEVEIGYLLSQSFHKKGYGLEMVRAVLRYANREFDFQRIVAQIMPENLPSLRLAEKCQMNFEKEYIANNNVPMHLYVKDFTKKIEIPQKSNVSKKVLSNYQKSPDTSVYSKYYHKK